MVKTLMHEIAAAERDLENAKRAHAQCEQHVQVAEQYRKYAADGLEKAYRRVEALKAPLSTD